MGKFNNYGGRIGKQNGDAGSFNNFGCIIEKQVVNNSKPNEPNKSNKYGEANVDWEEFGRRMREFAESMRNMRRG